MCYDLVGAPGLLAEFLVRERQDKLRNLLTVMGCDFRAYWLGTFIADFLLMLTPLVVSAVLTVLLVMVLLFP